MHLGMTPEESTTIREGFISLSRQIIIERINNQVALQLMVEKGIATAEEIAAKRDYIGKQPIYQAMNAALDREESAIKEENDMNDILKEMLLGGKKK